MIWYELKSCDNLGVNYVDSWDNPFQWCFFLLSLLDWQWLISPILFIVPDTVVNTKTPQRCQTRNNRDEHHWWSSSNIDIIHHHLHHNTSYQIHIKSLIQFWRANNFYTHHINVCDTSSISNSSNWCINYVLQKRTRSIIVEPSLSPHCQFIGRYVLGWGGLGDGIVWRMIDDGIMRPLVLPCFFPIPLLDWQ